MGETTPAPFYHPGGPVGLLALHGYTGAPAEMRPVGDHFADVGWMVRAPLLPGHGDDPNALNRLSWQDWLAGASTAYALLSSECETVFCAGLSMGALLTCILSHRHSEIAGIMLYSPALRVANGLIRFAGILRHVMPFMPPSKPDDTDLVDPEAPGRLWHYPRYPVGGAAQLCKLQQHVQIILPKIKTPALVVASTQDATLHSRSAQMTYDLLGSTRKDLLMLNGSGHCLTVDIERHQVVEASERFAGGVLTGP